MTEQLLKAVFVEYYYMNMAYCPEELQNIYGENSIMSIYDTQNRVSISFPFRS